MRIREVKKRIETARQRRNRSNCYGTALYISGVRKDDSAVSSPCLYYKYFEQMKRLEKPILFCLVLFRGGGRINHAGIVTRTRPLEITHRDGYHGSFREGDYLESVLCVYGPQVEYLKPRSVGRRK